MTDHPLANRLIKRFKHLQKWARRQGISCFRVYHKDLPDYPLILEWIDGDVVVWLFDRTRDDSPEKRDSFISEVKMAVCAAFSLSPDRLFIKFRRKQKGLESQYEKQSTRTVGKRVTEDGLLFEVNLSDYLDIGLFLDHRQTRQMVKELSKNQRVLNLFAYTGSFSCHALAGGALAVTTVDLNPNYSEWTLRNMSLNGFSESPHNRVVTQDCFQFLYDDANHRSDYDLIVCDPPTFSNSKRSGAGTFSIDEDYPKLLTACVQRLLPGGALFFSTNSRGFKLDPLLLPPDLALLEITSKTIPEDFKAHPPHRCWIIERTT